MVGMWGVLDIKADEATLAAFAEAERQAGHKLPLEYTTSSERLQARLGVAAAR